MNDITDDGRVTQGQSAPQANKRGERVDVLVLGPFPPPVHGQSAATEAFARLLQANGTRIERFDLGDGAGLRIKTLFEAFLPLLFGKYEHAYISANANRGMIFTAAYCFVSRLRGRKITVHHHAYSYIAKWKLAAALMARSAGPDALHLANCHDMTRELKSRYKGVKRALGYGNAGFVDPRLTDIRRDANDGPICIGHMSNLTEEKGVGRTIELFREARRAGMPVKLLLAGPCSDAYAKASVDSASAEFGPDFEYLGPVYEDAKIDFFSRIDIFVFPTRYVNEAGPLVNLEGMAAGAPVISMAQCCIPSTLAGGGGVAIKAPDDFIGESLAYVNNFLANRQEMSAQARNRFLELTEEQAEIERQIAARFAAQPLN